MASAARAKLSQARRIIVKLGTAVLTDAAGHFDPARHAALCEEILRAAEQHQVILVSSGAIALGVEGLKLPSRPTDLPGKQAAAAVGQSRLMHRYEEAFGARGRLVAQLLLTHADLADRRRYLNARQTLAALLAQGVIPVINENDTVSVEEIQFGDNDTLASLVVGLCDADLLVLLSDVAGLYTRDPSLPGPEPAALLAEVDQLTEAILQSAGGSRSGLGRGGMIAKLRAAQRAGDVGAPTIIASGKEPGALSAILRGEPRGTLVHPPQGGARLTLRKRWVAHAVNPGGRLHVDQGAEAALRQRGGSLLSSGLVEVDGDFERGSPVEILGPGGVPFARGLCGYDSEALRKLRGAQSTEIERLLGYKYLDEIVHRDDLALLAPEGSPA